MNDIIEKITAFNKDRDDELVKNKFAAMQENAFRFFRGACHVFFEDLGKNGPPVESPICWISGDLHMENFGSYKSDNRLVYFDLNDFDEAVLAPAHWEIARLSASIFVGFRSLGIASERAEKLAAVYLKSYAETLRCGKASYIERQTAKGLVADFLQQAMDRKQKKILNKKTSKTKDKLNINISGPKHLEINKMLKKELLSHMQGWLMHDEDSPYNYKMIDCAFRIAGTGSLGVQRYVLLMKSENAVGSKFILIDMKEATPSSLLPFLKNIQPQWSSEAERIKTVQMMMQNRPPALLSTTCFRDKHYIVQELHPERDNIDFKLLKDRYRDMVRVIIDMGMLTASAQLRSSGRLGAATADELSAFGKRTDWQEQVLKYAKEYADKTEKDFTAYTSENSVPKS